MIAVTQLLERLRVVESIDTAVGPITQRNRGFGLAQVLVGMAAAQLAGQDFLVGMDQVRADVAGQELMPVPGLAASRGFGSEGPTRSALETVLLLDRTPGGTVDVGRHHLPRLQRATRRGRRADSRDREGWQWSACWLSASPGVLQRVVPEDCHRDVESLRRAEPMLVPYLRHELFPAQSGVRADGEGGKQLELLWPGSDFSPAHKAAARA